MASEGAKLESCGPELTWRQLVLCQAELEAVAAQKEELRERHELLQTQERLFQTRCRFWKKQAKLLRMKRRCSEEGGEKPAKKKWRRDAAAALDERVLLVQAELASAQQSQRNAKDRQQACAARRVALETKLRDAEAVLTDKHWEVRAFAREHHRVDAQLLPHEMLREIFSHLSLNDRVTAGQVCSMWRDVVKYDLSLWRGSKLTMLSCHANQKSALHSVSCRVMAAAPFVDEVRLYEDCKIRKDLKIRKLSISGSRLVKGYCILKSCEEILPVLTALSLGLQNHKTAQIIDSKCMALKELSICYGSSSPFFFTKNFVKQSTLTDLRCSDVPILTRNSILAGHSTTLENISLRWDKGLKGQTGVSISLLSCVRLKCFQVDCRAAFSLPPSCEEVQLVVFDVKKCASPCGGCVSLAASSAVTRLRILCDDSLSPEEDIERHLAALGRKWLSQLVEVSIHCHPTSLSEAQRQTLAGVAGRSLHFRGPGRALTDWCYF